MVGSSGFQKQYFLNYLFWKKAFQPTIKIRVSYSNITRFYFKLRIKSLDKGFSM